MHTIEYILMQFLAICWKVVRTWRASLDLNKNSAAAGGGLPQTVRAGIQCGQPAIMRVDGSRAEVMAGSESDAKGRR